MIGKLSRSYWVVVVGAVLVLVGQAPAALIDLTSGTGSSGTINGAIFAFGNIYTGSGSGNIDAFVRLQHAGSEQGYNSSARPVVFDEDTSATFNHDLRLGDICIMTLNSVDYVCFLLDANESQGGGHEFLSLDQVKIYTSPTAFAAGNNPGNPDLLGTLCYHMDAGEDSTVLLDTSLSSGSGQTDMTLLVPVSAFSGAGANDYVFLYSVFGLRPDEGSGGDKKIWATSDGFEEWAVPAPEPGTLVFLLSGGLGLLGLRRRRAR